MLQPCRRLFASTTLRLKITLAAALCLVAALLVVSNLPATAANGERASGPSPAGQDSATAPTANPAASQALARLRGEIVSHVARETGYYGFVRARDKASVLAADNAGAAPEARALAFLAEHGALVGISDAERLTLNGGGAAKTGAGTELRVAKVSDKDSIGSTHVRFNQFYRGLPVFGGQLVVHMNERGITAVNGTFVPEINISTTPGIGDTEAGDIALAAVRKKSGGTGLGVTKSELSIYRTGLLEGFYGQNFLAYAVEVSGDKTREQVWVDAQNGGVLMQYSLNPHALNRTIYSPSYDGANPNNNVRRREGEPPTGVAPIDGLYDFAGHTYNLYSSAFGRDSYDGAGRKMLSVYLVNNNCPNAYWDSTTTNYCPEIDSDDVVSHEWSHAYTEYTHGLIYSYQSGALNESYSDIFGETVDLLNGVDGEGGSNNTQPTTYTISGGQYVPSGGGVRWRIGEDVQGLNQPPAGILRDMWTPPAFGNPDKLTSENYHCATSDGGGVHANSGVPNHAFAMLVDGKTFNGQTIAPIGLTRAAAIYWRAESVYQTPSTNFAAHDQALQTSCNDLIGAPLNNLSTSSANGTTSADVITAGTCQQVAKAMLAVEMSTPPTQCGFQPLLNPETPATCPDSATVFAENWEDGDTMGWTLTSTGVNTEWPGTNWAVRDNLPEGRTGKAAFAIDSRGGTCAPGGDISGQFTIASPVITIPAGATSARLNFDHYVETELEFDGGQLEYRVGTGAWTLMPQQRYTFNAPASRLDDPPPLGQNTNPNSGEFAWHGANGGSVSGSWGTTIVNLAPIVQPGQTIQLRWNFSQDGCNGVTGWFVDNIRVYNCPSGGDPNPTPTPNDPPSCRLPGTTVVTDPAGDQTGAPVENQGLDLTAISIAEPFAFDSSGVRVNKLAFTIQVADLSPVPPNGVWQARFNVGAITQYVSAKSDTNSVVTYEYGTINGTTVTPAGAPDAGSVNSATNSFTILVSNSSVGNPTPGQTITTVRGVTQLNGVTVFLGVDSSPAAPPVNYTLIGNASCSGVLPTPTPTPAPEAGPRYLNYTPPAGVGTGAGEPTLGANWDTGKIMYIAGLQTLQVSFDTCTLAATWRDVSFPTTSARTLDPILYTDRVSGTAHPDRTFVSQLLGKTSSLAYTDNDGGTNGRTLGDWTQSQGSGVNSGVDHQAIGGGPFAPPLTRDPNGTLYPNAIYYCSQDAATAYCALSADGGQTFGPAVPMYTLLQCGGLHGHPKVAPDGTVYMPNKSCGGKQAVVVSNDNGITWTIRPIPDSTASNLLVDPSVGIGLNNVGKPAGQTPNTIYFGYRDGSGRARAAASRDKGLTWSNSIDVGASLGVKNATFPAAVAGDDNRAAYAFLGTTTAGNSSAIGFAGVWYVYVAHTYDGGQSWVTVNVTPDNPVQRGPICNEGTTTCMRSPNDRNLLDFMDADVDAQGRTLVGYADGCIGSCVQGGANSFSALATIARQSGGKRLFAQFDEASISPPSTPIISMARRDSFGVHLEWSQPDDGGSPITAYRVYRQAAGGIEKLIATLPPTDRNYDDRDIEPGVTYRYRVKAVNAIGESSDCAPLVLPVVAPPDSPCALPGVQVLTDPAGDAVPPLPVTDVTALAIAETFDPANPNANKLTFTMRLGGTNTGTLPPNAQWYIIWTRLNAITGTPGADRNYVAMKTNPTGTPLSPIFTYGVIAPPSVNLPQEMGNADSGSYDPATGTIRIVISNSKIENIMAGQTLNNLEVRIFNRNDASGTLPVTQAAAQDFTNTGSYQLRGNRFCRPQSAPTAALTATPNSGPAPLVVNFDASGSSDPDSGDTIVEYVLDFGDGSPVVEQSSPTFTHTYNAGGTYRATLSVRDSRGSLSNNVADAIISVNAVPTGLQYYPLPRPIRLLDTRAGQPACDPAGAPITGGVARTQQARVTCDGITIPADALAVVGNATVVNNVAGSSDGFATLYPADVARPTASNLNYVPGQIVPNAFVVGLGASGPNAGAFNIFTSSTANFIVDVTGYYALPTPQGLYYHPLPKPVRLLDTRNGQPACDAPGTTLTAGVARTQQARVACAGVTIPQSAKAIVGNATVVNDTGGSTPGQASFVTLYPNGVVRPTVSNLNYTAGQIVPNAFTVALGNDGAFNIYATENINFIVDVAGYYSTEAVDVNGIGLFYKQLDAPLRLLDTRAGQPACDAPGAPLTGGAVRTEGARLTCNEVTIPADAAAIVGNATVINTQAGSTSGYVTLFPSGVQQPTASNLNYVPGQIVPNAFVVGLGNDGAFNIFATSNIDFIVDVAGFFAP